MPEIIPTIEQLIESFEKDGMEKFASDLKEVKAALDVGFRPKLPRHQQQKDWSSKQPGSEKFDRSQAEEIGLNIPTNKVKSTEEVEKRFFMGVNRELGTSYLKTLRTTDADRIIKDKGTGYFLNLVDRAEKQGKGKRAAAFKLVELSDAAKEKGFDTVAEHLKTAAYKLAGALVEEKHEVLSMESVFEKSNGPNDVITNLEKAQRVYEGAAGIVQLFLSQYKKNPPKDQAGVEDLVRKTDTMIARKFDELNKIK